MDNKVEAKFVIPALYQPESRIPLDIWCAAPSTTNGNEQAHRCINRDGIGLTLLAGVMRAFQYDNRTNVSMQLFRNMGIFQRDSQPTYAKRADRSIRRNSECYIKTYIFSHYSIYYSSNSEAQSGGYRQRGKTAATA